MYDNVLTFLLVPMIFIAPIIIGFLMAWLMQSLFIWIEEISNIYLHWFFNILIIFIICVIFNNLT